VTWLRRVADWVRGGRDAALRDELEAHRAHTQAELERAGLSAAEAASESRRRMGNVALARDDSRDVWVVRWIDRLGRDLRHGLRGLKREPLFALTAILTLGLGTGATTSVFSVVDAELWRPLPYPASSRLAALISKAPGAGGDSDAISIDELLEWRSAIPAFSDIAAAANTRRRSVRLDYLESMRAADVTANYFSTLGRRAIVGRAFTAADGRGANTAVLGERGWRRVFNADPGIVGRSVLVDNEARVIVGVVAMDDSRGRDPELFLPIDERPSASPRDAGVAFRTTIGRLAPGATSAAAQVQAQTMLDRRITSDGRRAGHVAAVEALNTRYMTRNRGPLYFFLGASLLVLALTVVNVAGLLLSRAQRRAPEFALRGALGGGTGAIASQLMVEAALIAMPGCLLGWWLTYEAMSVASRVIPDEFLYRGTHILVDYRAAAFCAAIVVATIVGFVFVPLRIARRTHAWAAMASGSRTTGHPSVGRARARLLIAQMAVTVVLLVGAALFLQSFVNLTRVPLGFEPADGWSMQVSLSGPRFADPAAVTAYANEIVRDARTIPGVRDAAIGTSSPLLSGFGVESHDAAKAPTGAGLRTVYRAVSADYFQTIGTHIVRGRAIGPSDVPGAPDIAVVNEQFAQILFPGEDPIGRRVTIDGAHTADVRNGSTVTIVGVASNIKEAGLNEVSFADIYVPFAQRPAPDIELMIRGSGSADTMARELRRTAAKADSAVPVTSIAALDARVAAAFQSERFNLLLVMGFAIVAVVIAGIGIYGAMAYAAAARTREFGVRLALGATTANVLAMSLWQAGRVGLIGGALGMLGTLGVAIWLGDSLYLVDGVHNGLLFGVTTHDPRLLSAAFAGVVTVSVAAGALPAWRASRVDPVTALRAE
jgi:predicted permease